MHCSIFPEKGALINRKGCTLGSEYPRRLQQKACYNLPEARRNDIPAVAVKQDVVCVNIQPDSATKVKAPDYPESANVMLQYGGVRIALSDEFNEQTLKRVLLTLRETVC